MDGPYLEEYISAARSAQCHFQTLSQGYQTVAPAQSPLVIFYSYS